MDAEQTEDNYYVPQYFKLEDCIIIDEVKL